MSKAILILDATPGNCTECPLLVEDTLYQKHCAAVHRGKVKALTECPGWCPLKNAEDFKQVTHGFWHIEPGIGAFCSVCGCEDDEEPNYCSNCGAKMDKGLTCGAEEDE